MATNHGSVNWMMPPPKYWYTMGRETMGIVKMQYT